MSYSQCSVQFKMHNNIHDANGELVTVIVIITSIASGLVQWCLFVCGNQLHAYFINDHDTRC